MALMINPDHTVQKMMTGKQPSTNERESKIHDAAEEFVSTYLSQFVEEMMTCSDISDEDTPEKAFYGSFLAQGLGKDLAKSKAAEHLVTHMENRMRQQAGLEVLPYHKTALATANQAYGAYQTQQNLLTRENRHVSATAA